MWILAFPSGTTGEQYLSHVVKACAMAGWQEEDRIPASCKSQSKSSSKKAKVWAVDESVLPCVYARPQVKGQIAWGEANAPEFALLARVAYQWALRVPSEALKATPAVFHFDHPKRTGGWDFITGRKHKPGRHSIYRHCSCKKECSSLGQTSPFCAYHTALYMTQKYPADRPLFIDRATGEPYTYKTLQHMLKALGRKFGHPNAARAGTQGWRRGHTTDRARKASSLEEILAVGDWSAKSRSYISYMRSAYGDIEARAACIAMAEEESGDES